MSGKGKSEVTRDVAGTREGFIPVRGGRVWYRIGGEDKPGVPLLVLHGGPGASHDYLEPLAELADERPVVFYDQLDCGNSDRPGDESLWTVERYVEELSRVRRALGLERVHILGQSWGASLAVDYLLDLQPEGVRSLILSAPLLSAACWIADQKKYVELLPEEMRKAVGECEDCRDFECSRYREAMRAYYRLHVCRLDPWPECLNRTIEKINPILYRHMWGASEFTVTGTLRDYERVERLREITVPVLLTCGCHDEVSPATAEHYRDRLPASELLVFAEASHEHHLEQPGQYLAAVRAFLCAAEG